MGLRGPREMRSWRTSSQPPRATGCRPCSCVISPESPDQFPAHLRIGFPRKETSSDEKSKRRRILANPVFLIAWCRRHRLTSLFAPFIASANFRSTCLSGGVPHFKVSTKDKEEEDESKISTRKNPLPNSSNNTLEQ